MRVPVQLRPGEEARCANEQIAESSCKSDCFGGIAWLTSMLNVSMEVAWRLFNKMPSGNVVSWNAILEGYDVHGHGEEALICMHLLTWGNPRKFQLYLEGSLPSRTFPLPG
jgi:hypothetical protein